MRRSFFPESLTRYLLAGAFLTLVALTPTLAQAVAHAVEAMPRLPVLREKPLMDGTIDEKEWKGALALPAFGQGKTETRAWVAISGETIYLAIRNGEPTPAALKIQTVVDEKKAAVWNDDSVEIFLDLTHTGESIFHLVCNPEGTFYDGEIIRLQHTPSAWDSQAQVRARVLQDAWEVEIALPMEAMGHLLQRGEVITLNVARNRHVQGGRAERSSLVGGKTYLKPEHFLRVLVEGPIEADGLSFVSLRRGPFFKGEPGAWEFQSLHPQAGDASLEGHLVFPRERERPTLSHTGQTLAAAFPGKESKYLTECLVRVGKQTLYHSLYKLRDSRPPRERVSTTADPVFEALLEPFPEGLSRHGIIVWPHEIDRIERGQLPLRTGVAFHPDDPYRQYAADGAILLFQTRMLRKNPNILQKTLEYGIPVMIWITHREAPKKGAPVAGRGNYPCWQLDPRAIEAYLEDARLAIELSRKFPNIQWLHSGDETWEAMHRRRLHFLDHRKEYPEFQAADREVREKFGFGKYGFPESSKDDNPFRWIATSRWEIASMIAVEKQVKALIRKEAPHLKFVSWDSMDGHHPYGLRRWGEVFDVITGQLYPSRNAAREDFSFYTKLYADLSGAKEIWPVPHVESYAARFTAEETEELLSQMFRGGATGMHLYLADTLAERAGAANPVVDRIGAPERWQVLSHTMERLRKAPFRVRQPEADTAIFYSNTSYQGQNGNAPKRYRSGEVEWAYTLLGPRLRSALRFVDDLLCQEAPEELERYRIIYIPYAPIADDAEVKALERYVERGGRLVVCDPLAFRLRSDGSERRDSPLLAPLSSSSAMKHEGGTLTFGERSLEIPQPAYPLQARGETVVAERPDGTPAILERHLGEGNVYFFSANPLISALTQDEGWIAFFQHLQQEAGALLDQKVWRFRFPTTEPPSPGFPGKRCLTGNGMQWSLGIPQPAAGTSVTGSYRLSRSDTRKLERAGAEIPFKEGRLTDRLKGARAARNAPSEKFMLTWSMDSPLDIVYRFDRGVMVETLRMAYTGELPAGRCEVSADGQQWLPAGGWHAQATTEGEVRLETLNLEEPSRPDSADEPGHSAKTKARYVRLSFEVATGGKPFTLVETDLWGDE